MEMFPTCVLHICRGFSPCHKTFSFDNLNVEKTPESSLPDEWNPLFKKQKTVLTKQNPFPEKKIVQSISSEAIAA